VTPGLWPGRWPAEDGGPRRLQAASGAFEGLRDAAPTVRSRDAHGASMVVLRDPGEVYLQGNGLSDPEANTCWVERIDPVTLEPLVRRDDLPGGPTWPGGIAALADGALVAVFGNHVHRLTPDLELERSATLPRHQAHNSFVVLPDGHLVTKDFGGLRPGQPSDTPRPPAELLVLDPVSLDIVARADVPEPSIARLSADGDEVYVVGESTLFRYRWDAGELVRDGDFAARYRTLEGQTFGWDAVLALGAAWFLDCGDGGQGYAGTFRGAGISPSPLHIVRVDLSSGAVSLTEVCGRPDSLITNPPLVDVDRRIVVGYDSSNGVLAGFDITDDALVPKWSVEQYHGPHLVLDPDSGLFLSFDHDPDRWMEQFVVRDITDGSEVVRLDTGSPLQSVVFPAVGDRRTVYSCSFSTVSSLSW
jgi:hypothetical protein